MEGIVDQRFKTTIPQIVEEVKKRVDVDHDEQNMKIKTLTDQVEQLTEDLWNVKKHAVSNDQYARRLNMRISGIPYTQNENLKDKFMSIVHSKLKIRIQPNDIEIIHRLAPSRTTGKRATIVKFRYRDIKYDVMRARKALQGSGITFSEDLCKENMDFMDRAKQHPKVLATWAWNGKIFAKDIHNRVHTLFYGTNLNDYFDKVPDMVVRSWVPAPTPSGTITVSSSNHAQQAGLPPPVPPPTFALTPVSAYPPLTLPPFSLPEATAGITTYSPRASTPATVPSTMMINPQPRFPTSTLSTATAGTMSPSVHVSTSATVPGTTTISAQPTYSPSSLYFATTGSTISSLRACTAGPLFSTPSFQATATKTTYTQSQPRPSTSGSQTQRTVLDCWSTQSNKT